MRFGVGDAVQGEYGLARRGRCSLSLTLATFPAQMRVVGHPESPQLDPLSVQPLTHFHFRHLVSNDRSLSLVCIFREQDWLPLPAEPQFFLHTFISEDYFLLLSG